MNILAGSLSSEATLIIQLIAIPLILLVIDGLLISILKRTLPRIIIALLSVLIVVAGILDLPYLFFMLGFLYFNSIVLFMFSNIGDFRWLVSNAASPKDRRSKRDFRKIYDQEELAVQLTNAVLNLSRTKMGALITIERTNQLTDLLKNGSPINAPVSAALLTTIFYKGTTLHDGAVVIRDDTILAASVYFTPSTKPLTGKVGSRHRAALGISEVSDSVTIVVSEETGRISFAYHGTLQPVTADDFKKTLMEYLTLKD